MLLSPGEGVKKLVVEWLDRMVDVAAVDVALFSLRGDDGPNDPNLASVATIFSFLSGICFPWGLSGGYSSPLSSLLRLIVRCEQ